MLRDFDQWMEKVDSLHSLYYKRFGESPLSHNEVACVGLMTAAASMAGFIPIMEYQVVKQWGKDRRFRVEGRADLSVSTDDRAYSFEFKRAWFAATVGNLRSSLNAASEDANKLLDNEYTHAGGIVIAHIRDSYRIMYEYYPFIEQNFADIVYRIGNEDTGGAYIFFKMKS